MQKAFNISRIIFFIALTILIMAILANIGGMDYILDNTSPSATLLKPFVKLLQAIDIADFYVTILSGISFLITYICKTFYYKKDYGKRKLH